MTAALRPLPDDRHRRGLLQRGAGRRRRPRQRRRARGDLRPDQGLDQRLRRARDRRRLRAQPRRARIDADRPLPPRQPAPAVFERVVAAWKGLERCSPKAACGRSASATWRRPSRPAAGRRSRWCLRSTRSSCTPSSPGPPSARRTRGWHRHPGRSPISGVDRSGHRHRPENDPLTHPASSASPRSRRARPRSSYAGSSSSAIRSSRSRSDRRGSPGTSTLDFALSDEEIAAIEALDTAGAAAPTRRSRPRVLRAARPVTLRLIRASAAPPRRRAKARGELPPARVVEVVAGKGGSSPRAPSRAGRPRPAARDDRRAGSEAEAVDGRRGDQVGVVAGELPPRRGRSAAARPSNSQA